MTAALVEFLAEHTGHASYRDMAEPLGMIHTTVRNQLLSDDTPVATLVGICRKYNIPLASAFLAAGFISADEALLFSGPPTLEHVSSIDLAREQLRRLEVAAG